MKDEITATGKWEFDDDVTKAFDDMLKRSIPQYDIMRKAVFDIGCKFVKQGTDIVDLGTSRGESVDALIKKFGAWNRFHLVDRSPAMLTILKDRYKGYIESGVVNVRDTDLRSDFPSVRASLVQSVLTIQFIPIEYRQRIIQSIYNSLNPGGAFIIVEKLLGNTSDLNDLMVNLYYNLKRENKYTDDQIERKRLSLEGVLVPVTARWNEELLSQAGFREVDCFWRWMNFAAWVAVR